MDYSQLQGGGGGGGGGDKALSAASSASATSGNNFGGGFTDGAGGLTPLGVIGVAALGLVAFVTLIIVSKR